MVFSVPHREDGREVLAALEEQTYDIIFMNCQMPEMDGEATRQIRKLSSSAPPRIIAMTANALAGDEGKMSLRGHG